MTTVLRGGRVFVGTGELLDPGSVVVDTERIVAVGPDGQVAVPAGAEVVDCSGKFVMPGLIDMHVHVAMSGGQASLYGFLGTGVTTVRDLGGDPDVTLPMRDEIERGERQGPRMIVYGPFVEGDPAVFSPRGGPPLTGRQGGMWIHTERDEIRKTIEDLLERGVDGIKLYAGLRPDLIEHAVRVVDGRTFVTAHLGRTWASEAVAAGVNGLEHVHASFYQNAVKPDDRHDREDGNGAMPNYWSWLSQGWSRADLDTPEVAQLIDAVVRNKVVVSPTAVLVTNGMATTEARDEPGLKYLPRAQQERRRQREEARRRAEQEQGQSSGDERQRRGVDPEVGQRALANELDLLRRIHDAGGIVVPSTDVGPTPSPGFSLHRELSLHVRAGIPASDVLQNATRVAAEALGRDGDLGTLVPGKLADILVVDGDPLTDINDTRRLERVMKAGVWYEPQQILERILAEE